MGALADSVTVEVEMPRDEYERVRAYASREQRSPEQVIPTLIEDGLASHSSARAIMERVADAYRSRLAASGDRELTADELLSELRRQRDEAADARYP